jgi:hypothetical protein
MTVSLFWSAASGYETSVSWIHSEQRPDFTRTPQNPTTEDLIRFTLPTSVFFNESVAERTLGGRPTLSVNPSQRTILLRFDEPVNDGVFVDRDPVSGLQGHFGPLEEGSWFFDVRFQGTIWFDRFDVGPPSPVISGRVRTFAGAPIAGVRLTFSNQGGRTFTNNNGFYSKSVPKGWSGTVSPGKSGFAFSPSHRTYQNVTQDIANQFYIGFQVSPPAKDFFTEHFSGDADIFDLSNKSVTFTPVAGENFYSGTQKDIKQLPTDPAGGTNLSLGDDDFEFVQLKGTEGVFIFGSGFAGFYVASNGYITFTEADTEHSETLSRHFETKRISALFEDLNPSAAGTVSSRELKDRVAVTWRNVTEYGTDNSNTFQIEMFFDGRIRISWLNIDAVNGIVGLSEGLGIPDGFQQTDISQRYPTVAPEQMNFVEHFSSTDDIFDLAGSSIMFTPKADGTSYSATLEKIEFLPAEPTGGAELGLGDDDFAFVKLGDSKTVSIFGSVFSSFHVGSNGYITFTEGDDDYSESLKDHFETRRISLLFDDLNPSAGGTVSWLQLIDRVAVTYENIPEFRDDGANTFQVEMFFDGRIRISWLEIGAEDGLVGLSDGLGIPLGLQETDFSKLN